MLAQSLRELPNASGITCGAKRRQVMPEALGHIAPITTRGTLQCKQLFRVKPV
jgi:hypothetical protein